MDAHALLTSQGWRGSGHSLHPTSDLNGLTRPLLVSRKQNNLGVGKKQHKTSDMWWMNAFDKSLKGLNTAEEGKVVQTVTNGGLDMVVKGGSKFVGAQGLYASFVRGESLSGTITSEENGKVPATNLLRRSENQPETREERRRRKAVKREVRARALLTAKQAVPEGFINSTEISEKKEGITVVNREETKERHKERLTQEKLMPRSDKDDMEGKPKILKKKRRRKD